MALTKLTTDLIDGTIVTSVNGSTGAVTLETGTDWQATPKTADFTAVAGEGYFVNTTSAAITVTLPSSPSSGDEVNLVDYAGTADTNNITITSSDNINGSSDDVKIDYERGGVSMVYVDATQGWIAYNAANETAQALAPDVPITVDYLVVAGGGGGGGVGGGGGAGGYRTSHGDSNVSALSLSSSTDYIVTIGAGGSANATVVNWNNDGNIGGNGVNSVFSTITSAGGGGGAGGVNAAGSGGSGGGTRSGTPGSGNTPSTTPAQGFAGASVGSQFGGGGGGAAEAGSTDGDAHGGDGKANDITGTSTYYAGGGAGGGGGAVGGLGGGAASGNSHGTPNTGGGGGGGTWTNNANTTTQGGGNGGSGVVILRYPDAYTITVGAGIIEASGSPFTEGSDKVSVFTGGTGNISFS